MSITVTVMYPNDPGSNFDMDYYLSDHVDLVQSKWGNMGLNGAKIVKGIGTPDPDTPAPYQVMAILDFESVDALQGAVEAHGEEVMGDIPNFTNVAPVVQISENIV